MLILIRIRIVIYYHILLMDFLFYDISIFVYLYFKGNIILWFPKTARLPFRRPNEQKHHRPNET